MRRLLPCVVLATTVAIATAEEPSSTPGMRVYRDPVTGKFGPPPPGAVTPPAERAGEEEPLVEEPGTTPAGGVTVDLKGRFRSTTKATLDPTGKVRTPCDPPAAPR